MPEYQGLGVKVARHCGPEVDPDIEDRAVGEEYRQSSGTSSATTCPPWPTPRSTSPRSASTPSPPTRTSSSTSYPARPDVIVASPCSGHGFKFSCLIGRVLADLAVEGATDLPIEAWKLAARS